MNYRMRVILTIASLFIALIAHAQSEEGVLQGEVSYITSSNIYVKFENTKQISAGDTLYLKKSGNNIAVLKVINKSSISCVATPLLDLEIKKGLLVFHLSNTKINQDDLKEEFTNLSDKSKNNSQTKPIVHSKEKGNKDDEKRHLQEINGRIAASAYTSFSNSRSIDDPRMKYTLSFKGENLANSNFFMDSYLSFRHQINHWGEVNEDFYRAFKVYNLALSYRTERFQASFGRKINRSVSNIGAVDGLQIAYHFSGFTFGGIIGTRPDVYDYSLNLKLPEAGVYLEHNLKRDYGAMKNTVGFFEQRSGAFTDRRYIYYQHSNSLVERLFLYASFQLDLYKKINDIEQSDFKFTSLYLSARYKVNRKFNIFASYDNRQNIIFYETYKNAIDRLIEQETRQGLRLRLVYRPLKLLSVGLSGTYRYQKNNLSPSKNVNIYMNFSRIPILGINSSISYTYLDTYFLQSHISGIRIRKDIFNANLGLGLHYRYVIYQYNSNALSFHNQIAGLNLNWRIIRDLSLSLNYEITLSQVDTYHRSYLKLIKRIR